MSWIINEVVVRHVEVSFRDFVEFQLQAFRLVRVDHHDTIEVDLYESDGRGNWLRFAVIRDGGREIADGSIGYNQVVRDAFVKYAVDNSVQYAIGEYNEDITPELIDLIVTLEDYTLHLGA